MGQRLAADFQHAMQLQAIMNQQLNLQAETIQFTPPPAAVQFAGIEEYSITEMADGSVAVKYLLAFIPDGSIGMGRSWRTSLARSRDEACSMLTIESLAWQLRRQRQEFLDENLRWLETQGIRGALRNLWRQMWR